MKKLLIIGASGHVATHVIQALDQNLQGMELYLATSRKEQADAWRQEGRNAVVFDLNKPDTYTHALDGMDSIFLVTSGTTDMLFQCKRVVDTAVTAGVKHIVHLGVYTSRHDNIPHYAWHDLIETYIEASGIAWTHLHPNVIADSVFLYGPPSLSMKKTNEFSMYWGNAPQGYVWSSDIGAVAAAALREGPEKHGGKNYYLSTEVLTGTEIEEIFSNAAGRKIHFRELRPEDLGAQAAQMTNVGQHGYMDSAVITMQLAFEEKMQPQIEVRDDVYTVLGRPGKTMAEWAQEYFNEVTNP